MIPNNAFAVILPAAGTGSRTGADIPKQFVGVAGEPVLRHTLNAFAGVRECLQIILVLDDVWMQKGKQIADGMPTVQFVEGGQERQDSIRNGLDLLRPDVDLVLVHDAARPLVTEALIHRVLDAASTHGAAIPGLPVAETVKLVDEDGQVVRTVPRQGLYTVQTPQGFQVDILRRAYQHAAETEFLGTDDASLVEELGVPVKLVEGEWDNLKITWREDFGKAEEILRNKLEVKRGK